MSQSSLRQEVAAMRAQADALEKRANDSAHEFNDPKHRDHLLSEVKRLREAAQREEDSLARHRNFH